MAAGRNPDDADASVTRAVSAWEKLVSQFSKRSVYRRYLADAKEVRARIRLGRGQIADARADLEDGLALVDALLETTPSDPEILRIRSQILIGLARSAQAEGNATETRRRADEAVRQLEAATKISPEYAAFGELLRQARELAESAEDRR